MYELALFAGAGGGILGGRLLGWHTVAAVEKEPYCREVLLRRQRDGVLPVFPIWSDVRTFTKRNNQCRRAIKAIRRCRPLVISAGFPCQPFSCAGNRAGEHDPRNMWPDTIRIIREIRPDFAFLENVPALLADPYIHRVFGDLADGGFDARWCVLSASDVGADHLRERLWIVAHPSGERREGLCEPVVCEHANGASSWQEIAGGSGGAFAAQRGEEPEPVLERVAGGIPHWLDRTVATGNCQVPQVAATAWKLLTQGGD